MSEKKTTTKNQRPNSKPVRTAEFPIIQKAVARAVQEYGETLKKLARDD